MCGDDEESKITYAGSAKIALEVTPPFDRYLFIEKNKKMVVELEKLKDEYKHPHVKIENDDANNILTHIAKKPIWNTGKYRGVIFLDPYGLQVDWSTQKAIASTKSFDIWLLFSISGVYRQMTLKYDKIEPYKKKRLKKIFGTDSWKKDLYESNDDQMSYDDLPGSLERTANIPQIEKWVKKRLETCFPFVAEPLALFSPKGYQLYSFFFCVSNPAPNAIGLARKVVNDILKQH